MDHQHTARSEKVPTKDVNEAVQKACQRGNYAEAVEELDSVSRGLHYYAYT